MKLSKIRFVFVLLGLVVGSLLVNGRTAHAQYSALTVNTLTDEQDGNCLTDGDCSLRDALNLAVDNATISFSVTGTIVLTNGTLNIGKGVTLNGPGTASLTISGNNAFRIFKIEAYNRNVTLKNLTLANGSSGDGAAIYTSQNTKLTLQNLVVQNNTASSGGAVLNNSSQFVTVSDSLFQNNTATGTYAQMGGGAIYSTSSKLTIENSRFSNNTAHKGGAIYNSSGNTATQGLLTINKSLFENNTALGSNPWGGGAIFSVDGGISATNSTFTGNSAAAGNGGAFSLYGYHNQFGLNFAHNTIVNNTAWLGGGILNASASNTVNINNTILANNSGSNCAGQALTSQGRNLVYGSNCPGLGSGPGDLNNVDPLLGPLQNNGGTTSTYTPQSGSPAINAGNCNNGAITVDQRGASRPQGTACDIGAVETGGTPLPTATPLPTPLPTPTPIPTATPPPTGCTIIMSTDVNKAIGPNAGTQTASNLPSNVSGTVADVNVVNLAGTHTYMSDLTFVLLGPENTQATIINPSCGSTDNFNLSLDDEAAGSWPCPPTAGTASRPFAPLTAFDNRPANGLWQLKITDGANGDGGNLASWGLQICVNPPSAPTPTPPPSAPICTTVNSTNVPKSVGTMGATNSSTLTFPDSGQITDVNVHVDGVTTWIGDLGLTLRSPAGTVVAVMSNVCSTNDNFNANLDDGAAAVVGSSCPVNGTYKASGSLAGFNTQNPNGTWTLNMTDAYPGADDVTLNNWNLTICYQPTSGFGGDQPINYDPNFFDLGEKAQATALELAGRTSGTGDTEVKPADAGGESEGEVAPADAGGESEGEAAPADTGGESEGDGSTAITVERGSEGESAGSELGGTAVGNLSASPIIMGIVLISILGIGFYIYQRRKSGSRYG